jgi:hypothetical protein
VSGWELVWNFEVPVELPVKVPV